MNRHPKRRLALLSLLLAALILAPACASVGPDYKAPETKMPSKWAQPPDPAVTPDKSEIAHWWTVFQDPVLTELISRATEGNLDLKVALARIQQARAAVGYVKGEYYPTVDSSIGVSGQRATENGLLGNTSAATTPFANFKADVSVGWEIDVWGRVRRSVEAATADLQATEEDRLNVLVLMYAQVAQAYLNLRTLQAQIKSTQDNIKAQEEVLELTRVRFKTGLAPDLDVAQAESVLALTRATLPTLQIQLVQVKNALAVLLGKQPGTLEQELGVDAPIPGASAAVAIGLPANLLRQRPDIRRTERQLAAQTARIGVAISDWYPSFSISGTIGLAATDFTKLFNVGSGFWSVGPAISWNIFQGGRIRANIKIQEALQEQARLSYEKAVLSALAEVENALASFRYEAQRAKALEDAVRASKRSLEMSLKLYKDGLAIFQNVLDAQRSVADQENQLAGARGNTSGALVLLYKALGGGWPGEQPHEAQKDKKPASGE